MGSGAFVEEALPGQGLGVGLPLVRCVVAVREREALIAGDI